MPDKPSCGFVFFKIARRRGPIGTLVLLSWWGLVSMGSVWGQQNKRELIYLDGKLVSVEIGSMTPLAVNVTSPTSNPTYSTNTSPIKLSGTLANHVGATEVTWSNDRGGSGTCSGTTTWTCSNLAMQIGQNVITISARDSLLNLGADSLTVAYCSSTLSPTGANIATGGGTGNVSVTCASGCAWTAASNNAWITVTGGSSGNGNGTVSYSVASNSGSARYGTITIAGQTFTISQAQNCSYSISPVNTLVEYGGGSGTVSVACASGCAWTAASNNAWITVTGGVSGSGNGTVSYSVAANANPYPFRSGTITIGGQTFTITQYPCPYCGDGFCFGEACVTCPQDCCPNCDMGCLYMCLYLGGDYGTCATQCGCN